MKIFVHKDTESVARDARWWDQEYEEREFYSDYSEYMVLVFERIEVHRSSATVWFRQYQYCEDHDMNHQTDRMLPMRIGEFEKMILGGHSPLSIEGDFGFKKQGTSVGLVQRG